MDNGSQSEMTLERLRYGGFIVKSANREPGAWNAPVFASASIDEALKFMRNAIKPIEPEQSPAGFDDGANYSDDRVSDSHNGRGSLKQ